MCLSQAFEDHFLSLPLSPPPPPQPPTPTYHHPPTPSSDTHTGGAASPGEYFQDPTRGMRRILLLFRFAELPATTVGRWGRLRRPLGHKAGPLIFVGVGA